MKKVISLILVVLIVFISATNVSQAKNVHSNYMDSWAEEEVGKAIKNKLVPVNMQRNYLTTINREEFCILAIRLVESRAGKSIEEVLKESGKEIAPYGTFSDCNTKEVRAAKTLGITDGTGPKTFSPKMKLTREQAAKFLTTTAIACGEDVELTEPDYADNSEIADWAKPYTGYLRKMGVLNGVDGNKFNPRGSYQRQQAFMTVYRLWNVVPKHKKHIDEISLKQIEKVKKLLNNAPYDNNYKAVFKGEKTRAGVVTPLKYELFYSQNMGNEKIRVDSYFDGTRESIKVYLNPADMTFTRMVLGADYITESEGYDLPFDFLTQNQFLDDLDSPDYISVNAMIVNIDGEKYVEVAKRDKFGGIYSIRYSLKYKFPVWYQYKNGDLNIKWEFESIDEDVNFVSSLFDKEAIKNGNYGDEDLDFVSSLTYAPYKFDFDLKMEGTYKENKVNFESPMTYYYSYTRNDAKLTALVQKFSEAATYIYLYTADITRFMGAGDWEDLGEGNKLEFHYLDRAEYDRLVNDPQTMRHLESYVMLDGKKRIKITIFKKNGDVKEYYYDADTKIPYKYVVDQVKDEMEVEVKRVELKFIK